MIRRSECSIVLFLGLVTLSLTSCIGQRGGDAETSTPEGLAGPDLVLSDPLTQTFASESTPPREVKATVVTSRRYQILEGFGAAAAWYQERIVGETPKGLYEALFPELGLDILRLRNRYQRSESADRDLAIDVEIVERATKALGHTPRILLSSWAPPANLKADGKERCRGNKDCTLKRVDGRFAYQEFADYFVKSLDQYREMGVVPEFVSIQNEPNFIPPDWEGCRFEPTETSEYPGYDTALGVVHQALSTTHPEVKLLGPEVMGIHYEAVQRYLAKLDTRLLYGVAHHLYEKGSDGVWDWRSPGPDSYVDEMQLLANSTRQRLFQTEFMTDEDKGIEGGYETAALIQHSLVDEGAVAFVYWDLIWDGAAGLIGMHGRVPRIRDQYFAVRHFSRYTDPGDVRVGATPDHPDLLVSGWLAPDERRLTLVLVNRGDRPLSVELAPEDYAATTYQAVRTVFRPGKSQRWATLPVRGPTDRIELPTRSMATVVVLR